MGDADPPRRPSREGGRSPVDEQGPGGEHA
jgi:hypothetical protein